MLIPGNEMISSINDGEGRGKGICSVMIIEGNLEIMQIYSIKSENL